MSDSKSRHSPIDFGNLLLMKIHRVSFMPRAPIPTCHPWRHGDDGAVARAGTPGRVFAIPFGIQHHKHPRSFHQPPEMEYSKSGSSVTATK